MSLKKLSTAVFLIILGTAVTFCQSEEEISKLTEVWEPVPQIVEPGENTAPPSDAILLLGNMGLSEWEHEDGSDPKWEYNDGVMTVVVETGELRTKRKFGDCQLHIEWRTPSKIVGEGQGRGNSGVFLQSRYEVQLLDSYNNKTYSNGQAGSVYKQYIPLVNASLPPGEWQKYDIIFTAPRFNENGTMKIPAYVTVIHNGVLIQNHVEIKGETVWLGEPVYEKHDPKEPLFLQDHGNPVSFRNIWIREL